MNRIYKMSILIASVIIIDQVTKAIVQQKFALGETFPVVTNWFHLTYAQNPGAAYSMFAYSGPWIRVPMFFILPVVACFWLVYLIWTTRHKNFIECLSYSLILAGAVGNLIDRFSMNYVVDFFELIVFNFRIFGVFNVADAAISLGAVLLAIEFLILSKDKKENATSNP